MREGGNWKDPSDIAFYEIGLTSAHQIMPILRTLPQRSIAPAGDAQLYKIDVDPHEDHDVPAEYPERVSTMARAWDAWFEDVTSQWQSTFYANADTENRAEPTKIGASTNTLT